MGGTEEPRRIIVQVCGAVSYAWLIAYLYRRVCVCERCVRGVCASFVISACFVSYTYV